MRLYTVGHHHGDENTDGAERHGPQLADNILSRDSLTQKCVHDRVSRADATSWIANGLGVLDHETGI